MTTELQPLGYWYGMDGTTYAVVLPSEVGDRPRWWIGRELVATYQDVLDHGFGVGDSPRHIGPWAAGDLHSGMPPRDCADEDVLALVIPDREPGPSDEELAAAIDAALKAPRSTIERGQIRDWIAGLPSPGTNEP